MSTNMKKSFEEVWSRIVECQGEEFRTKTGIPFTYSIVGDDLYPLHIASGHPGKKDFQKAYALAEIRNVSQLSAEGIMGPSYVYAILKDKRI